MARIDHPIHGVLAEKARVADGGTFLDLGCGGGGFRLAATRRCPGARVIGIDLRSAADAPGTQVIADLERGLPVASGTADAVVSHNLLECLADPVRLMDEAARVLVPGGIAVWSHTDFEGIAVDTGKVVLDRQIVHAYADQPQSWMERAEGRMGRRLAGLVNRSALSVIDVDTYTIVATRLEGDAKDRVDEMAAVLAGRAMDVTAWLEAAQTADREERFFFAETAFIVSARKP